MAKNIFVDDNYLQICSEKTLQTNHKGFFLDFASTLAEIAGDKWIKHVFGKLKTDEERLKTIYSDPKISDYVVAFLSNVQEFYMKKNNETSRKLRLEAEARLKAGQSTKALLLYSQSIIASPKSGENLVLSLLHRANLLISLTEYANALTDLKLCLKENLTDILKAEAFENMAICYKALGEDKKSDVALTLATKLSKKEITLMEIKANCKQIDNNKILPNVVGGKHDKFEYASRKIKVKCSADLGKYVVANEEVNTGDTLVVEPAYAACLFPENFGTHCHHCFERLRSALGCDHCSSVAFCKPECKTAALTTYHKYECKFIDLMIGSGMSILSHIALRMITQNTPAKSIEAYKNKNKEKVFTLCTNSHRRPAGDYFQRTLMAAFLLRCLQKSGYFKTSNKNADVLPSEEELQIGEMLLYNLQMLQFSAHEVFETLQSSENRLKGSKMSNIGVAVYPTVALFNHDCYPGVTRYFNGKHIVIKAIRPLKPNEIIAENYGPIFTLRKLTARQRALSARYWFHCQCSACMEDWPCMDSLNSNMKRLRCPTLKCPHLFCLPLKQTAVRCPKCQKNVSLVENLKTLKWCEEQYETGIKLIETQDVETAIKVLCPALDSFHKISSAPHKETHLAQEALRICIADGGNTYQCLVNSKSNK